jgi:hypothetical protein
VELLAVELDRIRLSIAEENEENYKSDIEMNPVEKRVEAAADGSSGLLVLGAIILISAYPPRAI